MSEVKCRVPGCGRNLYSGRDLQLCKQHLEDYRNGVPFREIKKLNSTTGKCSFNDCGRPIHSGGLCRTHYRQASKGLPLTPIGHHQPKYTDAQARADIRERTNGRFVPDADIPYEAAEMPWPGTCLDCGHRISPTAKTIREGSHWCKYCSGQAVHPDDAFATMKRGGVTPRVPYPGTNKKWECKCDSCGRIVFPMHDTVARGSRGCDWCVKAETAVKNSTPKPGESLADLHPDIARQADGWDPYEFKPQSKARMPWVCDVCNYGWEATLNSRVAQQSGCRECAEGGGYRVTKPGFLYVVRGVLGVAEDTYIKVGIANAIEDRLADHRRSGLTEVLHVWNWEDGQMAPTEELKWKAFLAEQPEHYFPAKHLLPANGYRETIIDLPEVREFIDATYVHRLRQRVTDLP